LRSYVDSLRFIIRATLSFVSLLILVFRVANDMVSPMVINKSAATPAPSHSTVDDPKRPKSENLAERPTKKLSLSPPTTKRVYELWVPKIPIVTG
jgi:hypothetical protein